MPHEILPSPHPSIVILRIYDTLEVADMLVDEELGLNKGPRYILVDISRMHTTLPVGFLDGAKKSFFIHDNMMHMALFLHSELLKGVAIMVAKITRRREKMSVFDDYDQALNHLMAQVK